MHHSQLSGEVFDLDEQDSLHDECGVFGVWAPGRDVARLTYFGTFALQHRGQDSAGIAVGDGQTVLVRKDLGLVNQVFSDTDLAAMPGKVAIGHVRYGTSGAKSWEAAQPHLAVINTTIIALAHNGTLVNTDSLRQELIKLGIPFRSNTDSEVAAKLVGYYTQQTGHLRQGIAQTMELVEGGYAMALVRENALYAFRDPNGIRPLVIGHLDAVDDKPEGWVVASETCALDIVGATYVRDVNPGEIVRFSDDGMICEQGIPARRSAQCVFEHIYFSRPDTRVTTWVAKLRVSLLWMRILLLEFQTPACLLRKDLLVSWVFRLVRGLLKTAMYSVPLSNQRRICASWEFVSSLMHCLITLQVNVWLWWMTPLCVALHPCRLFACLKMLALKKSMYALTLPRLSGPVFMVLILPCKSSLSRHEQIPRKSASLLGRTPWRFCR